MTCLRITAVIGIALSTIAVGSIAGAAATAPKTADQKFVDALKDARALAKKSFRQIKGSPPTFEGVKQAKANLTQTRKLIGRANGLAPQTVGATASEDVLDDLKAGSTAAREATASLSSGDYEGARRSINEAVAAIGAAQTSFGIPLAKEFNAFAVYRDFSRIEGFDDFLGFSAKVNAPIAKIVFGLAGRETANMAETGGRRRTPAIAITKLALYTLQEPSGAFSSNWCKLTRGIAVCDLDPTMNADEIFSVAFGPRVAKGTKFLVKFWSTDGRRSHAIMTTR
jgi:hypothetical protein